MSNFSFQHPAFLWLLLLLPLLIILRGRSGKAASIVFSSIAIAKEVSHSTRSSAGGILLGLRILALAAIIVALARPRLGHGFEEVTSSGIDIALTIDISGSMYTMDMSTKELNDIARSPIEIREQTRIAHVKKVVSKFIDKRPNDRLGLIAFAGAPYLVSPLTLNHDWLDKNLKEQVHVGRIEDGTAIGDALAMAVNRLRDLKNAKSRIIILLTDGDDTKSNIPPIAAAEAAASYKTKVYTILAGSRGKTFMIGYDDNNEMIPNRYNRTYLHPVENNANPEVLKNIAETTGGKFYQATNPKELESIYEEIDELEKTEVKLKKFETYDELYHWVALIALGFLLIEHLLANTKLKRLP